MQNENCKMKIANRLEAGLVPLELRMLGRIAALILFVFVLGLFVTAAPQAIAETGRRGETETGSKAETGRQGDGATGRKSANNSPSPVPPVSLSPTLPVAPSPHLPLSALLEIRELQYQQAKRALEMNDLEKRYAALQKESDAWKEQMHAAIAAGAKAAGVDLQKWDFDSDKLTFIRKEQPQMNADKRGSEKQPK